MSGIRSSVSKVLPELHEVERSKAAVRGDLDKPSFARNTEANSNLNLRWLRNEYKIELGENGIFTSL